MSTTELREETLAKWEVGLAEFENCPGLLGTIGTLTRLRMLIAEVRRLSGENEDLVTELRWEKGINKNLLEAMRGWRRMEAATTVGGSWKRFICRVLGYHTWTRIRDGAVLRHPQCDLCGAEWCMP